MGNQTNVFQEVSRGIGKTITVYSDKKIQFRDSDIYIQSSSDGQLDLVADTKVKVTGDFEVTGDFTFGDAATDSLTVTGKIIVSTLASGLTNSGFQIGNYSTALALGSVSEPYIASSINLTATVDDTSNIIGQFSKIATTGDSDDATFQAIYGSCTVSYNLADAYALRGAVTISGTPVVNQIFGAFTNFTIGECSIKSTGNISGFHALIEGSSDVTLDSGTVQGVQGLYIMWLNDGITTADTYGIRVGNGGTMDYAFALTGSGASTSMLFTGTGSSDNCTNFFKATDEGGFVGTTRSSPNQTATCDGSLKVLIGSKTLYIPLYNAITAA